MTDSRPLVTIVTPSFNQAPFLEQTIQSVLAQRYHPIEYFVMDGGSTDGSLEIIRRHESHLAGWASSQDQGAADAIARGFARGSGDILAWLNSDDVLAEDAVEQAVCTLIRQPGAVMVYGNRVCMDAASRLLYYRPSLPTLSRTPFLCTIIPQETCFWRRSVYMEVGGMDLTKRFAFDYALFSRLAQCGSFAYNPRLWAFFRKHSDSMTMRLTDTIGEQEGLTVQQDVWHRPLSGFESRLGRMLVRFYAVAATPFVAKPAWPRCLPPRRKVPLLQRVALSLHETNPLKAILRPLIR